MDFNFKREWFTRNIILVIVLLVTTVIDIVFISSVSFFFALAPVVVSLIIVYDELFNKNEPIFDEFWETIILVIFVAINVILFASSLAYFIYL